MPQTHYRACKLCEALNDLTDENSIDASCGTSVLKGLSVEVSALSPA